MAVTTVASPKPAQKLDAAALAALLEAAQADPTVHTLRLRDAGLTPNLAVQIADFLETNRSITTLDLTGNAIGSHGASCIAASLAKNGGVLRQLTLARCGLKSDVVAPFAGCLEQFASSSSTLPFSLQSLDLSNNQIDDDAAEALATLVTATSRIPDGTAPLALDLRRNWLADDAMRALAKALQDNRTLLSIRLEGNQDEEATIAKKQIAFCLQRNRRLRDRQALMTLIRRIRESTVMLHDCKLLHVELTLEDAQLLSVALRDNRSIVFLELRDNALPAEATRRIVRSLECHTSLRRLSIHDNQCGDVGFSALSRLVQRSTTLEDVAVRHSPQFIQTAATSLSRITLASLYHTLARDTLALRKLSLVNCAFGDLEIGIVGSGAAWACCLEALSLPNNQLTDRSAHVLVRLLHRCRRLHTLDVSGNRLTLDGVLPIARAVSIHENMRTLALGRFAKFESGTIDAIVGYLQTSATLVRVEFSTAEHASRSADRVHELMETWKARREASESVVREYESQRHAVDTTRTAHRTLVRQVAVRAVDTFLQHA